MERVASASRSLVCKALVMSTAPNPYRLCVIKIFMKIDFLGLRRKSLAVMPKICYNTP